MGNIEHSMDFMRLDAGSDWVNRNAIRLLWAQGNLAEARRANLELSPERAFTTFLTACADRPSAQSVSPEVDRSAREIEPLMLANPDPENRYIFATDLAFCGQKDAARRLLKSAIEGRYCSYQALQKDPLLASLRGTDEFNSLLSAAKQCQGKFLAERAQASH
jgi:hypothetical protein